MEKHIDKLVDGEEEESYASGFANLVFQDDDDDSDNKLELRSHKEKSVTVDDDENAEDTYTNSLTPRSPRTNLSLDKNVLHELTATVSLTADTTSQGHSKPTSLNTKEKLREIPDLLKNLILELTVEKINELIKEAVPRLINAAITRDREIAPTNVPELISQEFSTHAPKIIIELFQSHMQNIFLSLYPTTSSSTATAPTANIQHQLYLTMKANLQDEAANLKLWEILKTKFETS
nr:hypothetical protein [Tanacetum cinerariifolium]